jgi:hypothetical protein
VFKGNGRGCKCVAEIGTSLCSLYRFAGTVAAKSGMYCQGSGCVCAEAKYFRWF